MQQKIGQDGEHERGDFGRGPPGAAGAHGVGDEKDEQVQHDGDD